MHFARQVSQHIQLKRAGLGFLSLPPIPTQPRVFGAANRMSGNGMAEASDGGIAWHRRI